MKTVANVLQYCKSFEERTIFRLQSSFGNIQYARPVGLSLAWLKIKYATGTLITPSGQNHCFTSQLENYISDFQGQKIISK